MGESGNSGKKWLVGCGVGCAVFILLGILISVGGGIYMMRPFNKAIDAQKELEAEFGARDTFIPGPQGVTADRMEKFLAVRRELQPMCEEFRKIGDSIAAMDELDQGAEEPSKGEVFRAVGSLTGEIFGMVGNLGEFTRQRNEALVANRMSLGEYAWIYVLVYNSWMQHQPNQDFDESEGRGYSASERTLIRTLMLNHAEALEAAGNQEMADLWKSEIQRMERDESGVPFQDGGLPGELIRQFLPFETELARFYCEATSSFELNRVVKKGLSIHSD